jgi:hypothetical protein
MKTYSTYQEAKIENPKSDIFTSFGGYVSGADIPQPKNHANERGFFKCDPRKECISVYDFFELGKAFRNGDIYMQADGRVCTVANEIASNLRNDRINKETFILRARQLDESAPPVGAVGLQFTPKSKIKIDHVKVEESIFDLKEEYCSGSLKSNCGTNDNPKFETIMAVTDLAHHLLHNNVHRRVEVEVSEQDEFTDTLLEIGADCTSFTQLARVLYQSGRFKLVEGAE